MKPRYRLVPVMDHGHWVYRIERRTWPLGWLPLWTDNRVGEPEPMLVRDQAHGERRIQAFIWYQARCRLRELRFKREQKARKVVHIPPFKTLSKKESP